MSCVRILLSVLFPMNALYTVAFIVVCVLL